MSEYRAILVGREDIRPGRGDLRPFIHATASARLAEAFDAAGDQPPRKVCEVHYCDPSRPWLPCPGDYDPCRVVDAIVVPLEEPS